MSAYIDLGGIHTWYDERGEGEPLVLLHPGGAGVDARAWGPNLSALAQRFRVFTPERRAHGRTPDADGPITFELMANDTIAFLDAVVGEPAHLMGCSDGATVALVRRAATGPTWIRRLVFIAGVFHRDGWAPGVIDPGQHPSRVSRAAVRPAIPRRARALPGRSSAKLAQDARRGTDAHSRRAQSDRKPDPGDGRRR